MSSYRAYRHIGLNLREFPKITTFIKLALNAALQTAIGQSVASRYSVKFHGSGDMHLSLTPLPEVGGHWSADCGDCW